MGLNTSLANHLLIAMPSLVEEGFKQSVIYICEHHVQGTVGLIINQPMPFPMDVVYEQLNIDVKPHIKAKASLLFGGPIQPERGFVIHRPAGSWRSSIVLQDDVTITTSNDIIRAMAVDKGPKDVLVTLGYVGWQENQLEQEMLNNQWLVCPYSSELVYDVPFAQRWQYAGKILGVNMNELSSNVGHA